MKRLQNHLIGILQDDFVLFSDFENNGPFWTEKDEREVRTTVTFPEPYRSAPVVQLSVSMWDIASDSNSRGDLFSDNITKTGFDVVFRTWGDTRLARMRVAWTSIGELDDHDQWDVD